VPIVLAIAGSTLASWLIIGPRFIAWPEAVSLGITCFVSVMAIACPCALGLATPTGITVGLGLASKNGLLIKNAASLEKFGRTGTIVMDKTGTITKGEPTVSDILPIKATRADILALAASLEKNSEHPLAQAVSNLARAEKISVLPTSAFQATAGQGVRGQIGGKEYFLGNPKMMSGLGLASRPDWPAREIEALARQGKSLMILSTSDQVLGVLALADQIKEGAAAAIAELKRLGVKTIMLSGDRQEAADYIARQAGVDEVIAEISPLGKADKIREIKARDGIVAMAGDGVNDAVALVAADIGIAMASGSDIAIESADITVLHGDLSKIIKALKISRLTIRKIKQNLFWAFFYNVISIPIAAGALYPAFGILLSPIIAAGAMSFSSISIVLNTLLMRRAKI
jgi:heavy metal translocating P-type ATPase